MEDNQREMVSMLSPCGLWSCNCLSFTPSLELLRGAKATVAAIDPAVGGWDSDPWRQQEDLLQLAACILARPPPSATDALWGNADQLLAHYLPCSMPPSVASIDPSQGVAGSMEGFVRSAFAGEEGGEARNMISSSSNLSSEDSEIFNHGGYNCMMKITPNDLQVVHDHQLVPERMASNKRKAAPPSDDDDIGGGSGFRLVFKKPRQPQTAPDEKPIIDFQLRNGYEPETEAIAQVKEMIYRAAALRPVNLGGESESEAARRPKRKNVRISSDPQTVAARHRRERIGDRLRALQKLVPGGSKMDTASMLDEAASYLKFLKSQVAQLETLGSGSTIRFDSSWTTSSSAADPLGVLY